MVLIPVSPEKYFRFFEVYLLLSILGPGKCKKWFCSWKYSGHCNGRSL